MLNHGFCCRDSLGAPRAELPSTQSAAATAGGELAALLSAVKARQTRRDELTAAIVARESFDVRRFDRKTIEVKVHEYVNHWRALLTRRVEDGRQLLREVLEGPLRFTPEGKSYRFEGEIAFGRLLAGMVGVAPLMASPTGSDRLQWPIDRWFRAA